MSRSLIYVLPTVVALASSVSSAVEVDPPFSGLEAWPHSVTVDYTDEVGEVALIGMKFVREPWENIYYGTNGFLNWEFRPDGSDGWDLYVDDVFRLAAGPRWWNESRISDVHPTTVGREFINLRSEVDWMAYDVASWCGWLGFMTGMLIDFFFGPIRFLLSPFRRLDL